MLYNKNWDKSNNDPHSLKSLIDWLGTVDADATYDYYSNSMCLLRQYYSAKGYWLVHMGQCDFYHGFIGKTDLPKYFNTIAATEPHTFGAARKRALGFYFIESVEEAIA